MKNQLIIFIILFSLIFVSSAYALTINSVSTAPSILTPGEHSAITIDLENNGDVDIQEVSTSLDLSKVPFAPYDSASTYDLDKIREGKTESVEFQVVVLSDAASGIYKIPVQVSYTENGTAKTKNSLISLTVNSAPEIDVGLEDGLLLKGKENTLTLKVVNKGLGDVKFLDITLGGSGYTLLSPKEVYVGNLDSNDFDSVDFKVFLNENAPSTLNLPIAVAYKDALNEEYTKDFNIQAKVYTQEQAIQLGLLARNNFIIYLIVIIGLIVIWIAYRSIKKRRKLKKIKSA